MTKIAVFTALALAVGFVACSRGPQRDQTISAQVKQDLAKAELPQTITVTTNSGVVTLAGVVPDNIMRQRAENVAANAKDVRHVINNLQTTTSAGDAPARPNNPPAPPNASQNPAAAQPANPMPPEQPPLNAPGPDRG